ncbi:uncharacterized protein LOC121646592 [Melanotaenia boesemani]|uniref:uncharacterized protein LOC121646592 n=1 Tax=Melanotaenia boesemani TaxID=1250792 RepID=UPI001C0482B3|nr:uncharacterized protein LOC121646592 [Melanotaenia boesemani]XP_041851611.1 uncharacterized protein LOC121646592 [Melanotaenia boesemani]XP_041851612.1 uncharacterized protein LOC121646592 [Melanotaenia boesemani]XP_041851613.1 uncharacterized protein LOC121646592 [Melanotaenia boesemani]
MSHVARLVAEPRTWPIAPDGYIPNSVIRSLMQKEKQLHQPGSCLHPLHGCTRNDEGDDSTRAFWFADDEEKEEEMDVVNSKKSKREDEKNDEKVDKANKREYERKANEDDSKEKMRVLKAGSEQQAEERKESIVFQTERLRKHLETSGGLNALPPDTELHSTGSLNTRSFLPAEDEHGHKPLRDLEDNMEPSDTITPPLQYLSTPIKHTIPNREMLKLPAKRQVVSADIVSKTDSDVEGPPPLKAPPPSPEALQPELEHSLIRDQLFLLTSDKYDNIQEKTPLALNLKVMDLYKKLKVFKKKSSQRGNLPHSSVHTDILWLRLRGGLSCSWSTAEADSGGLSGHEPPQIPDNVLMPEWRKNLYQLIAQHGFRSQQAAQAFAAEHSLKSSGAKRAPGRIEQLQPGSAAAHQRVVQSMRMTDPTEPAPPYSHHIIPMDPQLSFFTSQLQGKTGHGRLESEWMRGSEEEKRLRITRKPNCR